MTSIPTIRTPRQWVRYAASVLTAVYEAEEAEAVAWWVVEEGLACSRTDILLSREERDFPSIDTILQRLLRHEPVQYVFGHTTWRGLDLQVTPATLIPRPETAELADRVLAYCPTTEPLHVLDACTGSGCLAIALKKERPQWQMDALDISTEALQVARANAEANAAEIRFFHHDLLRGQPLPAYDLIVSNPPYVRQSERETMNCRVTDYEPAAALFVPDEDALCFYRALTALQCRALCVEINEALGNEVSDLFRQAGYTDLQLFHDNYGKSRIICGRMAE